MGNKFEYLNFLIIVATINRVSNAQRIEKLLFENSCASCQIIKTYNLEDVEYDKDKLIELVNDQKIHFIISESTDFPFYNISTFDFLIPVVTEQWVYKCIETNKLVKTCSFSPDKRNTLRHTQIYISTKAFTAPEKLFYSEVINTLGGTIVDFISNKTTHLITTDPADPALIATVASEKQFNIQLIYPTWLCQSFKEGWLARENDHFINPEWSEEISNERLQDLWNIIEDISPTEHNNILEGHNFILGMDLLFNKNLYNYFISMINWNGGKTIRHIDADDLHKKDADCFVGYSVKSREYDTATLLNFKIGNIPWLFYMYSMRKFIDPQTRSNLVPYKKKAFEKSQLVLTFTNYFGQQRYYIQRLTRTIGGVATTDLSKKNTHLIFGFPHGKKYETGLKWSNSCTVVSHRWLEDCFNSGFKINEFQLSYSSNDFNEKLSNSLGQARKYNDTKLSPSNLQVTKETTSINTEELEVLEQVDHTLESKRSILPSSHLTDSPRDTHIYPFNLDKNLNRNISVYSKTLEKTGTISGNNIDSNNLLLNHTLTIEKECDSSLSDNQDKHLKNVTNDKNPGSSDPSQELSQNELETNTSKDIYKNNITKGNQIRENLNNKFQTPVTSRETSHVGAAITLKNDESEQDIETPSSLQQPTPPLLNGSRAAKAKAAKRLHTDIESLNEFERNSKKKRICNFLPEEITQLERVKDIERNAKLVLTRVLDDDNIAIINSITNNHTHRSKLFYNIDAICTGCLEDLSDLDLKIISLLGIRIYKETQFATSLNTIIAPKKMRTAKFLKSLAFQPLKYALVPEFITETLKKIYLGHRVDLKVDLEKLTIPGFSTEYLKKSQLHSKLFERAGITHINIMNDVPGGVEVISSILTAHGIKKVQILKQKFSDDDICKNDGHENFTSKKSKLCKEIMPPEYVIISNKQSQVKKLKKFISENKKTGLIVDWDWCVRAIFNLDIDLEDKKGAILI